MKTKHIQQTLFIALGWCLGWSISTIAEDWNAPSVTSNYANVISDLKARDLSNAKMDYSSATNLPSGVIRWSDTTGRFERWNGSTWNDLQTALSAHLTNTSNPHSVTTTQIGAATTSDLSAHTSNTSNPHSVTTTQIGALSASSNLNDVANKATSRSNLGVPSTSDLSAHTSNTSNPHSVTTTQIGALAKSSNLSDVANTITARSNIGAAGYGYNTDITALGAISTITGTYGVTISSGLSALIFGPVTTANRWKIETNGKITPPLSLQPDYTVWPSSFARRRSLDPSVATAGQCAEAWNTLVEDLIAQGELR